VKSPRWDTIGKIVIAYIENGYPAYALAALALLLLTSLAALGLVYLIGAPLALALG
jgi:hypothetical protein